MNQLINFSFDKLCSLHNKYFSLGYLNTDLNNKLALISLVCKLTYTLQQKNNTITCYDVLLKIGNDFPQFEKDTFFKSLAAICTDFMYGCEEFPDFGIAVKDMPKEIRKILENYTPF